MNHFGLSHAVFIVFVGTFSFAAAYCDLRTRRIPNLLTLPTFLLGWAYQGWFFGVDGLKDAGFAFALGFGTLFLLWLMGTSGGGDVKLMGALAVWLGLRLTMIVLAASTVIVLLAMVVHMGLSVFRRAPASAGSGSAPSGENEAGSGAASTEGRRILPYAIPVALATWLLLVLELPPV